MAWRIFVILQAATVVLGAVLETETIWLLADTVNGLMSIPNLIAIVCLLPVVKGLMRDYEEKNG